MAKQMFDNKKYSPVAWMPLKKYLFQCDRKLAEHRQAALIHFNKDSEKFFKVVALCLFKLATGTNVPWGRGAVHPTAYARIPIHEKARFLRPLFFLSLHI